MSRKGAYYNEHDPFAAAWLRELIRKNLIAPGDVDERDIQQVKGSDLDGYTQVHFFAGIGGWSYALRLAGWPDDRPVWTGSCPCQDFSTAGLRAGFAGSRDLWPSMRGLIEEREPDVLFGEQVDDAPEWWDRTAHDLEVLNYTCGAVVVPACAVGAPHVRHRLWWIADSGCERGTRNLACQVRWQPRFPRVENGGRLAAEQDLPNVPEPLLRRLGDGVPGGVDILRGYGNAIVPQVAARFIEASVMAMEEA